MTIKTIIFDTHTETHKSYGVQTPDSSEDDNYDVFSVDDDDFFYDQEIESLDELVKKEKDFDIFYCIPHRVVKIHFYVFQRNSLLEHSINHYQLSTEDILFTNEIIPMIVKYKENYSYNHKRHLKWGGYFIFHTPIEYDELEKIQTSRENYMSKFTQTPSTISDVVFKPTPLIFQSLSCVCLCFKMEDKHITGKIHNDNNTKQTKKILLHTKENNEKKGIKKGRKYKNRHTRKFM